MGGMLSGEKVLQLREREDEFRTAAGEVAQDSGDRLLRSVDAVAQRSHSSDWHCLMPLGGHVATSEGKQRGEDEDEGDGAYAHWYRSSCESQREPTRNQRFVVARAKSLTS